MAEQVSEENLVRRILEGVSGGYYPNAYFLYEKLPKSYRQKFSYWDVIKIFHELEWNVKVIEIKELRDSPAWNPWQGNATVSKKIIEYQLRPEFIAWKYKPGLFEKIMENLHQVNPGKIDFDITLN